MSSTTSRYTRNVGSQLNEFKKPLSVIRKKKKQKILSEEKYIEEMAKIIQRDFFPDLEKLRAQNEYLDAMDCKDFIKMELIRAKYSGQQPAELSRANTPATFETPSSTTQPTPRPSRNGRKNRGNISDTPNSQISDAPSDTTTTTTRGSCAADRHTLDSFLQTHTSEDNYSFQEIVDAADEKIRRKFAVLYGEEKLSIEAMSNALVLPSIEEQFSEPDPLRKIDTWTYKNKNSIMYVPDGVPFTDQERIDAANRKQEIQHSATRLQVHPFGSETLNHKGSSSTTPNSSTAISSLHSKIGMDGLTGLQSAAAAAAASTNCGQIAQVRGFNFVNTPSPRPGEAFSPLMTWGEIDSTPFRLDGSDTPMRCNTGPSFKITKNSRRETIGLALAEKVGEKMRAQKQRAMHTARKNMNSPFLRSNMERLASMSPAARQLATAKLGLRTTTPVLGTPSPMPRLERTKKTPLMNGGGGGSGTSLTSISDRTTTGPTLTDDLLQIPTSKPTRSTALDFF